MNRKRLITVLMILLCALWLAQGALAMSSTNYKLDWFTPLTSSGGPASSSHYAVHFSVGQSVIGYANNSSYTSGLGYWYGASSSYRVYLPLIMK